MKPHILIPLLVVCVGLPVVAMGTYYVCDNFPVAEEMRKREAQAKEDMLREAERIEEQLRQRGRAAKGVEEEDGIGESQKPVTARGTDAGNVTIKGVSINLPYEQLKQELAKKFGGIGRAVDDSRECENRSNRIVHEKAFRYFDYALLSRKNTRIDFNECTAFDGRVSLFPNCVRITFPRDFEEKFMKYVTELQKQYGDPIDHYQGVESGGSHTTLRYSVTTRIANDGIIHAIVDTYKCTLIEPAVTTTNFTVWYFGKSMHDYYMGEFKQAQRENENRKKQEEERERKRQARDAEGI